MDIYDIYLRFAILAFVVAIAANETTIGGIV